MTALYLVLALARNQDSLSISSLCCHSSCRNFENKKMVSWNFVFFFTSLNLLISRFWLPLNHGDWPSLEAATPQLTLEFPLQWYFMNHGPWVSSNMYWVIASIAIFTFSCIYIALKKKKLIQ